MSFLSTLGHIGSSVLGFLPIPGAGIASKALDAASSVGDVLGAGAANAKAGRVNDAMAQGQLNAANNAAQLNAAHFNMGTGASRLSQAAHADVLANAHNAPMTGDPRIDKFSGGGLRPDLFGADTRTGANDLKRQALMALMTKSDQVHPTMSNIPSSGILEKIGGAAGLIGGLTGAVGPALQRPRIATMQPPIAMDDQEQEQGFG